MNLLKVFLILGIISNVSFAAITQQQAKQARDASVQINTSANKIVALSLTVTSGNTYQVPGSTTTYSLTAAQLQDIVNYYLSLKADICTTQCAALP